ncbi:MAG: ECF transporter S component, partial [Holdemanella sp.]|nr:ECF transporter S component [Holdemanella sp.]
MKNKFSIYKICIIAFAICLNIVGGQIALILRLPIYLDSMGTIFIASLLGPVYGMIPSTLSGLIFGFTMDIYSLYYAPVGIILGFIAGFVCKKRKNTIPW